MVDKIDYARIMEMYKDRFKDASDFTFIFVGNIKPEETEPLIATYLGALPSVNRKETFRDNHIDMRQGDYKNIFNKKLETPKATVLVINNGQMRIHIEKPNHDEYAFTDTEYHVY